MKKTELEKLIKVIVLNPPTKEQADKRIKELSVFLEKIWHNPQNIE